MLTTIRAFSGFSINDLDKAKQFYTGLGLKLLDERMGLTWELPGGGTIFMYPKKNHEPATYTMLNFEVENIDTAVTELGSLGIQFERYEQMHQDDKGIARGLSANQGPDIAWFKDPAGNILSVMQTSK